MKTPVKLHKFKKSSTEAGQVVAGCYTYRNLSVLRGTRANGYAGRWCCAVGNRTSGTSQLLLGDSRDAIKQLIDAYIQEREISEDKASEWGTK